MSHRVRACCRGTLKGSKTTRSRMRAYYRMRRVRALGPKVKGEGQVGKRTDWISKVKGQGESRLLVGSIRRSGSRGAITGGQGMSRV